jgi:hypothetical protein
MSMALCGGSLRQPEGSKIVDEAADKIEELQRENRLLRALLQDVIVLVYELFENMSEGIRKAENSIRLMTTLSKITNFLNERDQRDGTTLPTPD